jgi:hypothetical protein
MEASTQYRFTDNLIPLVLGERLALRCQPSATSLGADAEAGRDGETVAARSRLFVTSNPPRPTPLR